MTQSQYETVRQEYIGKLYEAQAASNEFNGYAERLFRNNKCLTNPKILELSKEVEKLNLQIIYLRNILKSHNERALFE